MLDLTRIREAQKRIAPFVRKTPVLQNKRLNEIAGQPVFFKCENLQIGGAFKARGAFNAIFSLSDRDARHGVVTHSSGNHAGAVALAAKEREIPAFIVMPENVAPPKLAQVRQTGAAIKFCEPTMEARQAAATEIISENGATLIHPYNNYDVMAGQGTAAAEFLEEIPDLAHVLVPVSGGGLLSGTATAAKGISKLIRITAVEPEGAADTWESFQKQKLMPLKDPQTIADGLRASLGELPFPIVLEKVDEVVLVSDTEIVGAMRQLWEELRVIVEPSAAVTWAALREGKVELSGPTGIILTGGNVDLDRLPWCSR